MRVIYRSLPGPHISPPFVVRASRCRRDGGHGPEDGEGVALTTSSRLQGVRPDTASRDDPEEVDDIAFVDAGNALVEAGMRTVVDFPTEQ